MSNQKPEIDAVTQYLLDEALKNPSQTVVTKQTKIKRTASQLASGEGRKRNDPLYQRMVKYRTLYYKYREMLHQKYTPRVRSKARR
jgi:hypothetical protein